MGQSFKGKSREYEHKQFLNWLLKQIEANSIDVLIVAGDIFDTSNPPNYALKIYHSFLSEIIKTTCKDIVIVAGNHDGVSTLEVSKDLLKSLNVHVVASGEDVEESIIEIKKDEQTKAIICAVPFLRDRVLRSASESKSQNEVESELREGIKNYYKNIYQLAKAKNSNVPIIATGHFTTTGADISPDSEREIYIGKLQNIDSKMLEEFDYVAMGHIHKPQIIAKSEHIRYSGSPIPLSFSEVKNQKVVVVASFDKRLEKVEIINIPLFKELYRLKGNLEDIKKQIKKIANPQNPPFVEITVKNSEILNSDINEFIYESSKMGVDILMLKREQEIENRVLNIDDEKITLSELTPMDIFEKRLQSEESLELSDEMVQKLNSIYSTIVLECENEDN